MTGQWIISDDNEVGVFPLTWMLCGGGANSDYADTDGYYVVATQYFTTSLTGNANTKALSCVQYIDKNNMVPMDTETTYGAAAVCHVNNWSATAGSLDGTKATELVTMDYAMFA